MDRAQRPTRDFFTQNLHVTHANTAKLAHSTLAVHAMIMPLKPPQKSPLARDINILAVLPEAVQASCGYGPRHQLVAPL